MKRIWTKLPWLVIAAGVAGFVIYGLQPEPVEVDLVAVSRGMLEVTVDDDGETRIRERYIVSAPVAGKLFRIDLRAGDTVEQGMTELARIEPVTPALLDARARLEAEARVGAAQAALRKADAARKHEEEALSLALADFERAVGLLDEEAISRADFDAADHKQRLAKADVRSAEFGLQVAQFDLNLAEAAMTRVQDGGEAGANATGNAFRIISPIDGRVLRIYQEDAAVVTPGAELLQIGDPQDLEMEIDVLSTDAVRIRSGARVIVEHWGGEEPLLGIVRVVEPAAFLKVSALGVEEKRVNVIADFVDLEKSNGALGDGFRIEARIVVDRTNPDALLVPSGTLFRQRDAWHVYRVIDGVAQRQSVEVGLSNGLQTEILAGLDVGDELVLHPTDRVRDGVMVTPNQ